MAKRSKFLYFIFYFSFLAFLSVLGAYFYFKFNLTILDEKIYSKKDINFLFSFQDDKENNSLVVLASFLPPNKVLLFYVHPISQIKSYNDNNIIAHYSLGEQKEVLQSIIKEEVDYTIGINNESFIQIINMAGGLELYSDPNSLRMSELYTRKIGRKIFSGENLKDYLEFKNIDELDTNFYARKILRQESVFLTFYNKLVFSKQIVTKAMINAIHKNLEMDMNAKELYIFYEFLLNNQLDFFIYEVPGVPINDKDFILKVEPKFFNLFYHSIKKKAKSNLLKKELIKIEILNGTKIPKYAKKFSYKLQYNKKIKVYNIANSWYDNRKTSMLISRTGNLKATKYLKKTFKIKEHYYVLQKDLGVDATIILGED